MASHHLTQAYTHPPVGSQVEITTTFGTYEALVDSHLGRYFFAGGYRFHVSDDWSPALAHRSWRTAAAMAMLLNPEECQEAAAAEELTNAPAHDPWHPPPEPVGACEPTEAW
jgi:hypothetical protein